MSIFSFFRSAPRPSAVQAKERLQIVMAHERAGRTGPDYLPMLQQELLSVIAKYIDIDQNKVEVKLDRGGDCSTLELNIELPAREQLKSAMAAVKGAKPEPKPADTADGEAKRSAANGPLTDGGVKKRH
ncbi:cell division topological specificity factor MinE [Azospirillum doebereinerae]|uniref:Cell division topological specificity factor n=1 Tax=Azospirillum doebereinerae TaxID=92933 RepID=A0A3S0XDJ0_9PROT|nr:cell division topological specificity factor MinE [Azospirillum doebereinerae]MCG5240035.1 cell division topological specificity factor MinE [Azospirillum doebereinerae]RUQ74971.1 cell division topological specificity factor MinE [Azospirillum doebereinerae]